MKEGVCCHTVIWLWGEEGGTHGEINFIASLVLPPTLFTSAALLLPLQDSRKDSKVLYGASFLYFPARDRRQGWGEGRGGERGQGHRALFVKCTEVNPFPKLPRGPWVCQSKQRPRTPKIIKVVEVPTLLWEPEQLNSLTTAQRHLLPAAIFYFLFFNSLTQKLQEESSYYFPTFCLEFRFSALPFEEWWLLLW